MEPIQHVPQSDDEDLHMGSEYANARRYLAQRPRHRSSTSLGRGDEPQCGSNDTDFGPADQQQD